MRFLFVSTLGAPVIGIVGYADFAVVSVRYTCILRKRVFFVCTFTLIHSVSFYTELLYKIGEL